MQPRGEGGVGSGGGMGWWDGVRGGRIFLERLLGCGHSIERRSFPNESSCNLYFRHDSVSQGRRIRFPAFALILIQHEKGNLGKNLHRSNAFSVEGRLNVVTLAQGSGGQWLCSALL